MHEPEDELNDVGAGGQQGEKTTTPPQHPGSKHLRHPLTLNCCCFRGFYKTSSFLSQAEE